MQVAKRTRAHSGCLGTWDRRRTQQARESDRWGANIHRPDRVRMGQPSNLSGCYPTM